MSGTIDKCITADRPNKMDLIATFGYIKAINKIVNAIPDLILEAYKLATFGVKKTIRNKGSRYSKYFFDLIFMVKM